MKKTTIAEIISIGFILLFLYTAIGKFTEYAVFREQIALSPILRPISGVVAWGLPFAECAAAVLLFVPNWRLYGFYAASGLMIAFTGYVGAILIFDQHLPCSCGGIIELLSWKQHLLLNSALVGLAVLGIRLQKKGGAPARLSTQIS